MTDNTLRAIGNWTDFTVWMVAFLIVVFWFARANGSYYTARMLLILSALNLVESVGLVVIQANQGGVRWPVVSGIIVTRSSIAIQAFVVIILGSKLIRERGHK